MTDVRNTQETEGQSTEEPVWKDPHDVLGVARDATPEQVRSAYLQRVKEHPPDRSPVEFEQIRDAYDVLRDPKGRVQLYTRSMDHQRPLRTLLGDVPPRREHVGPKPWLDVVKGDGAK